MSTPRAVHWHVALKLVQYLHHTAGQGLLYAFCTNPVLTTFCDADWGSCQRTRQSLTGYCVIW